MTDYDPFERGPQPVGTRSFTWRDGARERSLPVDVWYPATDQYQGQDLDDATKDRFKTLPDSPEVTQDAVKDAEAASGSFPMVIFSHGFAGERRQSTHLCTHLASHGFVVAGMDHVGNTTADMLAAAGTPPDPDLIRTFMADRPADASFVIDRMLAGDSGLTVDPERIGISGHSFGGWTSLMTTASDARIRAVLPLAPAGGRSAIKTEGIEVDLAGEINMDWKRSVPVLYLLAEFDSLLPLDGMRELFDRTGEPRSAVVLLNSDHFHFCDRVAEVHDLFKTMGEMLMDKAGDASAVLENMKPSAELCPGDHAYALTCGLGLAHFDAHLRDNADAAAVVDGDLTELMASRGIAVDVF